MLTLYSQNVAFLICVLLQENYAWHSLSQLDTSGEDTWFCHAGGQGSHLNPTALQGASVLQCLSCLYTTKKKKNAAQSGEVQQQLKTNTFMV